MNEHRAENRGKLVIVLVLWLLLLAAGAFVVARGSELNGWKPIPTPALMPPSTGQIAPALHVHFIAPAESVNRRPADSHPRYRLLARKLQLLFPES